MQSTKHCKEVIFECTKVTFFYLKSSKHCKNHWGKDTTVLRKENFNHKQKNTRYFTIPGIKDLWHWKKVNSKKEKVGEAWCSRKLNVKYHGYHTLEKEQIQCQATYI